MLMILCIRFALVLAALCCTIYVGICDYQQWQDKPVVTSLKVGGVISSILMNINMGEI